MGRADFFLKGQWAVICDICGQKYHSAQLKERWDGLMCCEQDWNLRQAQDFVRGVPDPQAVPWSRPDVSPPFTQNPLALSITDFYGIYLSDFTGQILVTFPTTVQSVSINASTSNELLGGQLQVQDGAPNLYFYATPGSRLDNLDVEGFALNGSELA